MNDQPAIRQGECFEREQAHEEALEMNAKVVYHRHHGTRAYMPVGAYDHYHTTIRPLSGGMEWTYHKDMVSATRPS